jgi:hypothetical protein
VLLRERRDNGAYSSGLRALAGIAHHGGGEHVAIGGLHHVFGSAQRHGVRAVLVHREHDDGNVLRLGVVL